MTILPLLASRWRFIVVFVVTWWGPQDRRAFQIKVLQFQLSSGGEFPIGLIHIVEDVGLEFVAGNQISIRVGIRLASKEAFAPAARWSGSEGYVLNHGPNGSFCGGRQRSSASCSYSAGAGSTRMGSHRVFAAL